MSSSPLLPVLPSFLFVFLCLWRPDPWAFSSFHPSLPDVFLSSPPCASFVSLRLSLPVEAGSLGLLLFSSLSSRCLPLLSSLCFLRFSSSFFACGGRIPGPSPLFIPLFPMSSSPLLPVLPSFLFVFLCLWRPDPWAFSSFHPSLPDVFLSSPPCASFVSLRLSLPVE